MQVLENIPRISRPTGAEFQERYLARQEPVIVTDLFANQELAVVDSLDAFRQRFHDLPIGLTDEFFPLFLRSGMVKPPLSAGGGYEWTTVGSYVSAVAADPTLPRMCSELPLPCEIAELFEVPELCDLHYREDEGIKSLFFLGHAGRVAHLHFDGDHHHVLFHQVFGRKRVTLFRPQVSKRLTPCIHWSLVSMENMSDGERSRFMHYGEAWDCVLQPGETLYMPPLIWHHLDYVDFGLSINFRFGQSPTLGFLSGLIPELHLQNVAARLIRLEMTGKEPATLAAARTRLISLCEHQSGSPIERFQRIEEALRDLYSTICTDSVQGSYAAAPQSVIDHNLRALLPEKPIYTS